ncbi:TPA: hypothetical protein U1C40_000031 [Streptococcus suis]|nr:hypothetical protein [Streptococcus suis]HEM3647455.1 hypothetical protein [Streptococcus suis]
MIQRYRVFYEGKMYGVKAVIWTSRGLYVTLDEGNKDGRRVRSAKLMQSTGLFDKNGAEVFEGDVVKLHHFTECYSDQGGFYEGEEELIGFIKYGYTEDEVKSVGKVYPPRWLLKTSSDEIDFSFLYGVHEESFEIIGNVYENPELVEVE